MGKMVRGRLSGADCQMDRGDRGRLSGQMLAAGSQRQMIKGRWSEAEDQKQTVRT